MGKELGTWRVPIVTQDMKESRHRKKKVSTPVNKGSLKQQQPRLFSLHEVNVLMVRWGDLGNTSAM